MKKEDEEAFSSFETKIDEVTNILKMMNSTEKTEQLVGMEKADQFLGIDKEYQQKLDMDDFIVQVKDDRTVINHKAFIDEPKEGAAEMDKFVFMNEVERDAKRRAKERKERERVAQNLRNLGNQAFQYKLYEKAVTMYTKAIDQIKDSTVLYTNRALAYNRLGVYKRAIIDCDFVLQKLDEKNMRAWIYRAMAYFLMGEHADFEKSVVEAKKSNPKEIEYIESAVAVIQGGKDDGDGGLDDKLNIEQ